MRYSRLVLVLMLLIGIAAFVTPALDVPLLDSLLNWGVIATILVILTGVAFFLEFERTEMSSKEIALVAMLGTISAVLRVPFAAVGNGIFLGTLGTKTIAILQRFKKRFSIEYSAI